MGVRQYELGRQHALRGYRRMHHRSKNYDSRSAQTSYDNGYSDGLKEKYPNQYQGTTAPASKAPLLAATALQAARDLRPARPAFAPVSGLDEHKYVGGH